MNISEAARMAGLPVKTVRYYADIGLVAPAGRSDAGYRQYDDAALRRLIFVRRARDFGFTIEACRDLLGLYGDERRTSAEVKRLACARLREIEQKQRELQSLHDTLADLVEKCHGDDRPDCPIIEHLA